MVPSDPPRELAGFWFARIFDGVSPDYAPRITAERGFVTEDEERSRRGLISPARRRSVT